MSEALAAGNSWLKNYTWMTELIFVNSLLLPPLFKLGTPTKAFGSHKTLSHFIWPPISLCNQFKSNRLVLLHPTLIKKLSQIKWPILNIFSDRNKFCPSKLQQTILYFSLSGPQDSDGLLSPNTKLLVNLFKIHSLTHYGSYTKSWCFFSTSDVHVSQKWICE